MDALLAALEPRPRARWWVAAAAGAIVVSAAVPAAILAGRDPPCQGAEARLVGVWDAPVKARVAAALQAHGLGYAAETWRAVESTLDRYTSDWVTMHTQACEATRVHGEQS